MLTTPIMQYIFYNKTIPSTYSQKQIIIFSLMYLEEVLLLCKFT